MFFLIAVTISLLFSNAYLLNNLADSCQNFVETR
jgi:hypothetical protein